DLRARRVQPAQLGEGGSQLIDALVRVRELERMAFAGDTVGRAANALLAVPLQAAAEVLPASGERQHHARPRAAVDGETARALQVEPLRLHPALLRREHEVEPVELAATAHELVEDRAQRVPRAVRAYEQLRELVELATVDAAEQAPAVEPPRPAVEGRDADELPAIPRDDRLELGVARVVARPDRQPAGIRERVPRAGCLGHR